MVLKDVGEAEKFWRYVFGLKDVSSKNSDEEARLPPRVRPSSFAPNSIGTGAYAPRGARPGGGDATT